jgi:hypothetical protein
VVATRQGAQRQEIAEGDIREGVEQLGAVVVVLLIARDHDHDPVAGGHEIRESVAQELLHRGVTQADGDDRRLRHRDAGAELPQIADEAARMQGGVPQAPDADEPLRQEPEIGAGRRWDRRVEQDDPDDVGIRPSGDQRDIGAGTEAQQDDAALSVTFLEERDGLENIVPGPLHGMEAVIPTIAVTDAGQVEPEHDVALSSEATGQEDVFSELVGPMGDPGVDHEDGRPVAGRVGPRRRREDPDHLRGGADPHGFLRVVRDSRRAIR